MQIFNFFNARKLSDEFNIFSGLFTNSFFVIIVGVILIIEVYIYNLHLFIFRLLLLLLVEKHFNVMNG